AVLCASYVLSGDDFVQRIHAAREADFGVSDASTWDDNQLEARLVEDACGPYNLECDSVIRLNVYSRSPESHVLMLGVHHIAFDYWSYDVFALDLIELYACDQTVNTDLATMEYQLMIFVRLQIKMMY